MARAVMTPWTSRCCESNCIETRQVGDQVEIRDTERPEATLLVPAKAWEEFLLAAGRDAVHAEWAAKLAEDAVPDDPDKMRARVRREARALVEAEILREAAADLIAMTTDPFGLLTESVGTRGPIAVALWLQDRAAEVRNNEGESRDA